MLEKEQYIYVNGRFVKVGGTDGVEFKEVSSLPTVGEDGVIYLLPSEEGQGSSGGTSIKVDGETVPELDVGDGLAVENGVLKEKWNELSIDNIECISRTVVESVYLNILSGSAISQLNQVRQIIVEITTDDEVVQTITPAHFINDDGVKTIQFIGYDFNYGILRHIYYK